MSDSRKRLSGGRRRRKEKEEIKPMQGVANLVDVMLVFACGLMIAIILRWNIDFQNVVNILDSDQLVEITDSDIIDESQSAVSEYDNLGTAIQDPDSGKMLVVEDDNIAGEDGGEGQDSGSSGSSGESPDGGSGTQSGREDRS